MFLVLVPCQVPTCILAPASRCKSPTVCLLAIPLSCDPLLFNLLPVFPDCPSPAPTLHPFLHSHFMGNLESSFLSSLVPSTYFLCSHPHSPVYTSTSQCYVRFFSHTCLFLQVRFPEVELLVK